MAQNEQEIPWSSQHQLAHNSCWGETNFPQVAFVFFFGLFRPWYECICYRFDCRMCCDSHAGIFKWNFDYFLWETRCNVKESRLTCGSHAQLMCRILLDLPENVNIQINISFTNCLKCGNFRVICLIYEGIWINLWLPCTVNVQDFVRSTRKCKYSNKYFFYKLSEMWKFRGYLFNMWRNLD